MTEVERLKWARDTWKANADCWEALANKHRETAAKLKNSNDVLRELLVEAEEHIKLLRKKLNETTKVIGE